MAADHVENGRRILARHRERMAEGGAISGYSGVLLATFEQSQLIFEADLAHLSRVRDMRTGSNNSRIYHDGEKPLQPS
jgi:hypothetical protein